MTRYKILVPDAHLDDMDLERTVSGDRLHYVIYDESDPMKIPDEAWRSCDGILIWHRMRLDAGVVARLDKCRMIVRCGVGYDNVDTAACSARGIPVSNTPSYGTTEVADHALALLLYLVRGLGTYEKRLRADLRKGFLAENVPVARRIRGATFGAIGMGRIGTAVARRAQGFDMKVIYFDPFLPEGHELGMGIERCRSKEDLLHRADIVSLHVPLSAATRNIIGAPAIAVMKQDSILINIARGGLVDVEAVYEGLRAGPLAAAGLDVLPNEPPVPAPRLLDAWQKEESWLAGRFVVTPHAAFYSEAGYRDMRVLSIENLIDFLFNGRLRNNVNPDWNAKSAS